MIIEPIDNRLYKVSNILPDHMVQSILSLDWFAFPCSIDERLPLRRSFNIHSQNIAITDAEDFIYGLEKQIEDACNIKFDRTECMNTTWWYDLPGFNVPMHTDGPLPSAMQLFWVSAGSQYGTKFYNTNDSSDVKYDFPFIPNSGYLMLNCPDASGYQPLQWHGMLNDVPENSYRLTSYTRFGTYTDK